MSLAMTLHFSLTVGSLACRPRRTAKKTTLDNKQNYTMGGFGGRKKDELWRCVEGCGACCKLNKDRPYFCRVEPDVFKSLYGIEKKKFNKESCSFCRDTIKAIYGSHSEELYNFNNSIRSSSNEILGL